MRVEPVGTDRDRVSFVALESFLALLYKPFEIELANPKFSIYLSNEEKLPIWLCAVLPRRIYAGVAVTISEFDKDSKFKGSTVIFLDDRKTCLETEAPLTSEGHLLIEMSGDTSYME